MIKSALLATVLGLSFVGPASADLNEQMKNSKYCENYTNDVICMGPELRGTRTTMLEMTKEKALENRTKYCQDSATSNDPICDPKMINDTTGF